ncbi:hypothetical protein Q9189_003755 [Teloschistes chrysophthalmus]
MRHAEQELIALPDDAEEDEKREYETACHAIVREANRLWAPSPGSTPIFTPDGGHDKYWARTGYPLADYQKTYDRLDKMPPNPYLDCKDAIAQESLPHESAHSQHHSSNNRTIHASITYLATRYMSSHPGLRSAPSNTALQNDIEMFRIPHHTHDREFLKRLHTQLLYRTWMLARANTYRQYLNLNKIPPIQEWDPLLPTPTPPSPNPATLSPTSNSATSNPPTPTPLTPPTSTALHNLAQKNHSILFQSQLFTRLPPPLQPLPTRSAILGPTLPKAGAVFIVRFRGIGLRSSGGEGVDKDGEGGGKGEGGGG